MTEQTLEDLKAENAKAEEETSSSPQGAEEELEAKAVEENSEVDAEGKAEALVDENNDSETESWMSTDEDQSNDIPNAAWKGAREKYKAKLSKVKEGHDAEIDKLKAQVAELQGGPVKQLNRPKREDFYDQDDPEGAFIEALTDFTMERGSAKQAATVKQAESSRQQQAQQEQINEGVDKHYERALKLSEESGITAETYQASDRTVRTAIDAVLPGAGDAITDKLITDLGAGSEKVFYSLGVNAAKRSKLQNLLTEDSSGLKAAMFLGELKAQLNAPQKRKTNAPKPAPHLAGDATGGDEHATLKKEYDKASKSGNTQAAFTARMKAKGSGANVSNW